MQAAEKWLGKGYRDMGGGRFVSRDGLRQFRYRKHEVRNALNHHAHFEAYTHVGGTLSEKSVVTVIK